MKFDRHFYLIFQNLANFNNKKFIINYLKYYLLLSFFKKNQLKLGQLTFEIKKIIFNGFLLYEDITIRYIKQDNTIDDESSFEA
jgi:hypothetical protein